VRIAWRGCAACGIGAALPWSVAVGELPAPLMPFRAGTSPELLRVRSLSPQISAAAVSDLEAADFDGDGAMDLAVAWFATSMSQPSLNERQLTFFRGTPTGLTPWTSVNLYLPDPTADVFSVFRNGTADMAVGDFDGDGDPDVAVTAYFGDELWIIENLGGGVFAPHLKFPFDINSPANFMTPPEAGAADFDGDGRDELVYLSDPIQHINGRVVHFWTTSGSIEEMQRVEWEGIDGGVFTQWTRAMAIADFSGDGRPDLCFSGTHIPPNEEGPILTFWHSFDASTQSFRVANFYPTFLVSDIIEAPAADSCRPRLLLADLNGTLVEEWHATAAFCAGGAFAYAPGERLTGYSGLAPDRGVAGVAADINGDGLLDLVMRQRYSGTAAAAQLEFAMADPTGDSAWLKVSPGPLSCNGLRIGDQNQILRPRAITTADVVGNRLPDVIAGFGPVTGTGGAAELVVAIWTATCRADVNFDGRTNPADRSMIMTGMGACAPAATYDARLDVTRDGCVSSADAQAAVSNFGCACGGDRRGDLNCDNVVSVTDISAFVLALTHLHAYYAEFPACDPAQGDMNGDGELSITDVTGFVNTIMSLP
jgi:hypothetical protein